MIQLLVHRMCTILHVQILCRFLHAHCAMQAAALALDAMTGSVYRCTCKHFKCAEGRGGFQWVSRATRHRHVLADTLDDFLVPSDPAAESVPVSTPVAVPGYDVQMLVPTVPDAMRDDDPAEQAEVCCACVENVHTDLHVRAAQTRYALRCLH
jgi:hypothetical protein